MKCTAEKLGLCSGVPRGNYGRRRVWMWKAPLGTHAGDGQKAKWREDGGWEVREVRMMGQGERRKPHLGQWGFE